MNIQTNIGKTSGRLSLADFYSQAIGICNELSNIHKRGEWHGRLNIFHIAPDNESGKHIIQPPQLPPTAKPAFFHINTQKWDVLELNYLAPEQTGRTENQTDQRSDIYSLGAIFYELLTGTPPFAHKSPTDVIYHHLAIVPDNICKLRPDIPTALGMVIGKLLEKNKEER